jgi:L-ascorbate metabolism protein UlaG (beta-lactamase superfamily)
MVDDAVIAHHVDNAPDRIVFLGHASVLIELDGVRLLTDPLLRGRVAHLRRQAPMIDRSVFAGLDAVLISHMHHDHLDLASLRLLSPNTPVLVPAGAGEWLRKRGFTEVAELSVGDVTRVGVIEIAAVEARHDGRRPGGPQAIALGYVAHGRRAVYFAGDTECFPGMSNFSPSPDVALLPVAGWGPKLGPGHMDPLEAARAVALIEPRLAIPVHWGTLLPLGLIRRHRAQLGDPPRLFAERVAQIAPGVEVRILAPGQATLLQV